MSDFSPDQDELASAYLDDDATVEERALVEADAVLLARVEQLRSVRDALAEPVAVPTAEQRDAAIAAALGAANVVNLEAARGQRRLRIASIAAAVVLVVGAAGFLIRAADDGGDQKFAAVAGSLSPSTTAATAEKSATAAGGTSANAEATAGADADEFLLSRTELGSFADRSSLAAAVGDQATAFKLHDSQRAAGSSPAPATDNAPTTSVPTCLVPPPADATGEVYAATAVLQGRSVQVDVFTLTDGSLLLVVTDAASCAQVFTQPV